MEREDIRYIKGIGPRRQKLLNRLGIYTVKDLLYYFPYRYEDRRNIRRIKELRENEISVVMGRVLARNLRPLKFRPLSRGGIKNTIFEVAIEDGTGVLMCVWFNQGYLKDYIKVDDDIVVYGKVRRYKKRLQMVSPEFEIIDKNDKSSSGVGRIVGFYRLTEGVTQKMLRSAIKFSLDNFARKIEDPLPYHIRESGNLPNIYYSLKNIHFPDSLDDAALSRRRFIFEELFFSQVLVYVRKAQYRLRKSISIVDKENFIPQFKKSLPFLLTSSQERVIKEIVDDLAKPYPMHRLLQGDVGSGKTVVASFAIALAVINNCQVAFMVPTEVIVHQHVTTLKELFKNFGFRIKSLTSALTRREKEKIYSDLKTFKIDIVVGTHALIEEEVEFNRLGLVVIDEQHKFGVAQRALLPKKAKDYIPHCLVMSATPIPRSLALSLYGDLDFSVIDELPPGRKQPKTIWVEENKREWVYNFLREKLNEGRQVYIVYPVIDEANTSDLHSLTEMYEVAKKRLPGFKVGVFHGRMKSNEKKKVIREFRENKINVLISTTVIEVGVNIENATVMVVENPERFGLAQLHQLRGRIRRSVHDPYFILISKSNIGENARRRLEIISKTTDGFKVSEEDLKLRGPGDFFGSLQWGFPQLRIASPIEDLDVLKEARKAAYDLIKKDPFLKQPYSRCIREHIDFWLKRR